MLIIENYAKPSNPPSNLRKLPAIPTGWLPTKPH